MTGPTPFVPGPGVCRVCWLYAAGLLQDHDAPPATPRPTPAAPPPADAAPPAPRSRCASLGTDPAPGATAARLGLSTLRQWHPCAKGRGTAGHVCLCAAAATCGACPDWTPAAD